MALRSVLIFIDWFVPAYKAGGPIQSVLNLTAYLGKDFELSIVTSDRDLGDTEPYTEVELNKWIQTENYRVIYLDSAHQSGKVYKALLKEKSYQVVYFNSLFSVKFALLPLWLLRRQPIKKVLAPRGMLGSGALQLKPFKKQMFLRLFKWCNLHKQIIWHATSSVEAKEIQQHFGPELRWHIADNLSAPLSGMLPEKAKEAQSLKVFFLSRISKKKNLILALRILEQTEPRLNIQFTIIGAVEDSEYWHECESLIDKLPRHITVVALGAVPHANIADILLDQHVLLLPTLHENFGHVIMESWQHGCPVVISEATPWKHLEQNKVGFDINLAHLEQFVAAINFFGRLDAAQFEKWSASSYRYAKNFCENPSLIEASRRLFEVES